MDRKLICVFWLVLASCGCCSCDSSCDYLPPVLEGPYYTSGMRSGSAAGASMASPETVDDPAITPLPAEAPVSE